MTSQAEAQFRTQGLMITVFNDSYVRLTWETLLTSPLVHLLSGLDEDKPIFLQEGASLAHVTGYTEWISTAPPTMTIGWDWGLDVSEGQPRYKRLSTPRSNIMFVDAIQHDLGPAKTAVLLEAAVDAIAWQEVVEKYIVTRYEG